MSYQHKRSSVAGKVPTPANFKAGEIIVNTADGRGFVLTPAGVVGIGAKEKSSDSAKLEGKTSDELPVSTATQAELNGKLSLTGGIVSGSLTVNGAILSNQFDVVIRNENRNTNNGQVNYSPAYLARLGAGNSPIRAHLQCIERVGSETIASIYAGDGGSEAFLEFNNLGNLKITGRITAGSKSFIIDHPLDPANKNLLHTSIETARNEVQYSGTTQLNNGEAIVTIDDDYHLMPGTIAALSKDGVVTSLVNQSGFSPLRFEMIEQGKFKIICQDETSNDLVVWSYAAIRNDPFTLYVDSQTDRVTGNFIAEQDKAE